MAKYFALAKGSGEGCDYTIGCNHNWQSFEANNDEDARTKAIEVFPPAVDDFGIDIESIMLLRVAEEIPMAAVLNEKREQLRQEAAEQARLKKMAALDQLKRELGQ